MDQSPQAPGTAPAAHTPPPAPFFQAPVGNPRLRAVKEPDKTRSKGRVLPHIMAHPRASGAVNLLGSPAQARHLARHRTRRHSR